MWGSEAGAGCVSISNFSPILWQLKYISLAHSLVSRPWQTHSHLLTSQCSWHLPFQVYHCLMSCFELKRLQPSTRQTPGIHMEVINTVWPWLPMCMTVKTFQDRLPSMHKTVCLIFSERGMEEKGKKTWKMCLTAFLHQTMTVKGLTSKCFTKQHLVFCLFLPQAQCRIT